jgi:hypothetical protein
MDWPLLGDAFCALPAVASSCFLDLDAFVFAGLHLVRAPGSLVVLTCLYLPACIPCMHLDVPLATLTAFHEPRPNVDGLKPF